VSFGGREWQTLQLEIAKPEADEIELVPVAVGIAAPVACVVGCGSGDA
jgi:hypothetical protein